MQFFCFSPIGIRVGYASPRLLRSVPRRERNAFAERVVLVLSANRRYTLHGVRPGARLAPVARRLHVRGPFHIGLNYWYLVPDGSVTGVLKVRHGIVEEVGIASRSLTRSRRAAIRFLRSFS